MIEELIVYVVYKNPSDYERRAGEDIFVIKRDLIKDGEVVRDPDWSLESNDYEPLAKSMMRRGLERMPRDSQDDPAILETWI